MEIIRQERLDGVILDLLMPGMSGFEVLEQLRSAEATRTLPVIVYTSKILSDHEKQQLEELGVPVLSKAEVAQMLSPDLLLSSLARVGISPSKVE
jgi:CheY-like chemotaxis protein